MRPRASGHEPYKKRLETYLQQVWRNRSIKELKQRANSVSATSPEIKHEISLNYSKKAVDEHSVVTRNFVESIKESCAGRWCELDQMNARFLADVIQMAPQITDNHNKVTTHIQHFIENRSHVVALNSKIEELKSLRMHLTFLKTLLEQKIKSMESIVTFVHRAVESNGYSNVHQGMDRYISLQSMYKEQFEDFDERDQKLNAVHDVLQNMLRESDRKNMMQYNLISSLKLRLHSLQHEIYENEQFINKSLATASKTTIESFKLRNGIFQIYAYLSKTRGLSGTAQDPRAQLSAIKTGMQTLMDVINSVSHGMFTEPARKKRWRRRELAPQTIYRNFMNSPDNKTKSSRYSGETNDVSTRIASVLSEDTSEQPEVKSTRNTREILTGNRSSIDEVYNIGLKEENKNVTGGVGKSESIPLFESRKSKNKVISLAKAAKVARNVQRIFNKMSHASKTVLVQNKESMSGGEDQQGSVSTEDSVNETHTETKLKVISDKHVTEEHTSSGRKSSRYLVEAEIDETFAPIDEQNHVLIPDSMEDANENKPATVVSSRFLTVPREMMEKVSGSGIGVIAQQAPREKNLVNRIEVGGPNSESALYDMIMSAEAAEIIGSSCGKSSYELACDRNPIDNPTNQDDPKANETAAVCGISYPDASILEVKSLRTKSLKESSVRSRSTPTPVTLPTEPKMRNMSKRSRREYSVKCTSLSSFSSRCKDSKSVQEEANFFANQSKTVSGLKNGTFQKKNMKKGKICEASKCKSVLLSSRHEDDQRGEQDGQNNISSKSVFESIRTNQSVLFSSDDERKSVQNKSSCVILGPTSITGKMSPGSIDRSHGSRARRTKISSNPWVHSTDTLAGVTEEMLSRKKVFIEQQSCLKVKTRLQHSQPSKNSSTGTKTYKTTPLIQTDQAQKNQTATEVLRRNTSENTHDLNRSPKSILPPIYNNRFCRTQGSRWNRTIAEQAAARRKLRSEGLTILANVNLGSQSSL